MPEKSDERWEDLEAEVAAEVVSRIGGTSKVALAASVSDRRARDYTSGRDRGNPYNRAGQLLERSGRPFDAVAYFLARAVKARLQDMGPMVEWRWRSLFRQACQREQEADGHEDVVTQDLLWGDPSTSMMDLYNADHAQVAPSLERMALALIGIRMGWDPRGPLVASERTH